MQEGHDTPRSPFDHGLFFPLSSRRFALEELRNAIAEPAGLITCVGEEGSGKTTILMILEKEPPPSCLVISFPSSVDSFDYILQIIALKLDLTFSGENDAPASTQLIEELTHALRNEDKRLLILIDEAEKLYLATLERIRKMIDLINMDDILLQIVLFGRPGLLGHLEQLALCTFRDTREVHLVLPPLTAEDTCQYLNLSMQQLQGSEKKNVFSLEAAAKILTVSHGDFRKINELAAESLRSSSQGTGETSFMVLLEHVRDQDHPATKTTPSHPRLLAPLSNRTLLGGGAVLLLILLFLLTGHNNQGKPGPSTETPSDTTRITAPPLPFPQPPLEQPNLSASAPLPADRPDHPSESPTDGPATPDTPGTPPVEPALSTPVSRPETAKDTIQLPVAATVSTPQPATATEAAPVEPERMTIRADQSARKNRIPLLVQKPVRKNRALLNTPGTPPTLPQKSLERGKRWLSGEKNDHFTLQIMVLSNEDARDKLTAILHNRENREGIHNFTILTKATSPTTFLLFYGEYPTLDNAGKARDTLPPALRKYSPYPVSVRQAVTKSR